MKLIRSEPKKTLRYWGYNFTVDASVFHIACDPDGRMVGFKNKPVPKDSDFWEDPDGDYFEYMGMMDLEGLDWLKSLQSYDVIPNYPVYHNKKAAQAANLPAGTHVLIGHPHIGNVHRIGDDGTPKFQYFYSANQC